MALYEHIYLSRQDISAQQVDALTEQFKGILESLGGRIEKVEYWGVNIQQRKMRLAIFVDAIGERFDAPIFDFFDTAA